ncbi:MAG TPA: hypothetical protein VKA70_05420 [Blastocatellia bacterium]|nr:hypothetical protein [Blastocatellia bacterium]
MMPEETDKREHSLKPEVDDLTDYQSLNSLGGAGVAGAAEESAAPDAEKEEAAATESSNVTKYDEDYNDGSDFSAIDNEGETNA